MKTKYTQRMDGEGWNVVSGKVFRLACCDCGLVHDVVIVTKQEKIGIAAKRNNRATAKRRKTTPKEQPSRTSASRSAPSAT